MEKMGKREKAFWAVYFNIAEHDLKRTLGIHLNRKFKSPKEFVNCFKQEEKTVPEVIQSFEKNIDNKKRFPFYKPIELPYKNKKGKHIKNLFCDLKYDYEKFHKLYEVFNKFRNHYSHLETIEPTILNNPTDEDKAFIGALQIIYDGAVNIVKDKFKLKEYEIKDYRGTLPGEPKKGESNLKTNGQFKWKLDDEKGNLTQVGEVFLASICMQKRFRGGFFEGLKNLYKDKEVYNETFRRICDALAIRVPNPKIQSEQDDFHFGMDILNTLRKCPDPLFKHIENKEQKKFIIENKQEKDIFLKRNNKNHKFEMLALRYLEGLDVFKNIGIFSYIGNFYSKCYDKNLNGEKEKRRAYSLGHLFGEKGILKHLENAKDNKDITNKIREEEPEPFHPYISKVHAKYIINKDKIGFSKIDLRDTKGNRFILPKYKDDKFSNPEVKVWLSKNELPALVFYAYLLEKRKKLPIEHILFNHQFEQKAEKDRQKTLADRILHRIKAYIDESEKEINKIKKDGQMASWLLKDIMNLQPSKKEEKGRDKITTPKYIKLQISLATNYIYNWRSLFNKAKLLSGDICHPFLKEVMNHEPTNIEAFYKKYLTERKSYFENWKKEVASEKAKGKINFNDIVFQKLFKNSQSTKITSNKKFLPRGIFTESIKVWFRKYGSEQMKNIVKEKRVNVAYMIQKYFQIDEKDSLPNVYSLPRHYKFLGEDYNYLDSSNLKEYLKSNKPETPKENERDKDILKRWRQYKNTTKNEDKIRLWGIQDRLLFLMSKKVMPEDMVNNTGCKLKNIEFMKTNFNFKHKVKEGKVVTYKFMNTPLKDFGRIERYKTDSRIDNLSKLLYKENKENIFSEQDLADEFSNYEKYRLEVFEAAFGIEEEFKKKYPHDFEEEFKKKGYVSFEYMLEKMGKEEEYKEILIDIRNNFAHTDYVKRKYVEDIDFYLPDVAKYFRDEFNRIKKLLLIS